MAASRRTAGDRNRAAERRTEIGSIRGGGAADLGKF